MAVFDSTTLEEARTIVARYPTGRERSAVMPLLYLAQSVEGRVTRDGLQEVATLLGITTAEVEAVASFSPARCGARRTSTRRRTRLPESLTARSSPRTRSSRCTKRSAWVRARRRRSSRWTSYTTTT
jgi:hypothetical protein